SMHVQVATNQTDWDAFLIAQQFSPFLQSWTMGEVYREIGQEPIRLEVRDQGNIVAICLGIVVPAKRGRHLMVQYGPICDSPDTLDLLINKLKDVAAEHRCSFIRMSPFW